MEPRPKWSNTVFSLKHIWRAEMQDNHEDKSLDKGCCIDTGTSSEASKDTNQLFLSLFISFFCFPKMLIFSADIHSEYLKYWAFLVTLDSLWNKSLLTTCKFYTTTVRNQEIWQQKSCQQTIKKSLKFQVTDGMNPADHDLQQLHKKAFFFFFVKNHFSALSSIMCFPKRCINGLFKSGELNYNNFFLVFKRKHWIVHHSQ